MPPTKYEERILGRASFPTFKTELANPHSVRPTKLATDVLRLQIWLCSPCCFNHWQGVEAMQLGAKQSQLTASTGTSGFPSIIDSRRPVLHSQHIPTFCSATRQHSSSRSARESSSLTHWQHYDDWRCNSLEGVHSTCFTCSHRECRARSCHCAHLRPLQRLRYRLFVYPLYIARQALPRIIILSPYLKYHSSCKHTA